MRPGCPSAPRWRQIEVGEIEAGDSSGAHDRLLDTSQVVVVPGVVRVEEGDEVRPARVDSGIPGATDAAVVLRDESDAAPVFRDDLASVVGRAVVDDDDLVRAPTLA